MNHPDFGYAETSPTEPTSIEVHGFRVVRTVGTGGFSVVYEAIQEVVEAPVALKVLTAFDTEDRRARDRFVRECKTMGQLRGTPGIAWINQATFTADGRPVIVMEYYPNGTIADRIKSDGPLPMDESIRIAIRVAEALDAAHSRGIYHRDLKPENLLIGADGNVALADFGIAVVEGVEANTQTLVAMSPPHSPPERVDPTLGPEDKVRSDVYSLTSTLYTMLTGHTPFDGGGRFRGFQLMSRILHDPLPPLARGDAPPGLMAVLERGMAKQAHDRFASAAELAAELRRLVAAPQPEAAPISETDIRARQSVEFDSSVETAAPYPPRLLSSDNLIEPAPSADSWWVDAAGGLPVEEASAPLPWQVPVTGATPVTPQPEPHPTADDPLTYDIGTWTSNPDKNPPLTPQQPPAATTAPTSAPAASTTPPTPSGTPPAWSATPPSWSAQPASDPGSAGNTAYGIPEALATPDFARAFDGGSATVITPRRFAASNMSAPPEEAEPPPSNRLRTVAIAVTVFATLVLIGAIALLLTRRGENEPSRADVAAARAAWDKEYEDAVPPTLTSVSLDPDPTAPSVIVSWTDSPENSKLPRTYVITWGNGQSTPETPIDGTGQFLVTDLGPGPNGPIPLAPDQNYCVSVRVLILPPKDLDGAKVRPKASATMCTADNPPVSAPGG